MPSRHRPATLNLLAMGAVVTTALGVASTPVMAQSSQPAGTTTQAAGDLPSAESLIENAIKAMGGEKAFKQVKSSHSKMSMASPMGAAEIEAWIAEDDFKVVINQMGMQIEAGGDGENAWMKNPMTQAWEMVEEGQAKEMKQMAAMYNMVPDMESRYDKMTTVGEESFNDLSCYVVECIADDSTDTFYFDKKSGHVEGVKSVAQGPMGPIETVITMKERKKFGDLEVVTLMEMAQMDMNMTMTIEELEFNKVSAEMVAAPAEVKEMLEEKATSQPTSQPGG
ncbi:MAG: hypothetical protein AAF432_04670 [Planctomycetota bacterium]